MNSNNLAALVLATGLWIGLAAWVMGGSTRPRRGVLDEHKFRQSREPSDAGPRQLSSSGSLCLSGYRRDRDPLTKDLRPCRFRQGRSRDEKRVDIAPSPVRSLGRAQGAAAGLAPQPPQHDAVGAVSTECDPTHAGARLRHCGERHHSKLGRPEPP